MTTDTSKKDERAAGVRTSRWWTEANFNLIVALATLAIIAVPVGVANIYLGYVLGESPCTSCAYERFGMVVVGGLGLLILRYGPHYKYVVTLLLAAFFFLYSTIRHWNYHVVDDIGQGFASEVFGVHTYTWGAFVFWIVIGALAIGMIFVARDRNLHQEFSGQSAPVKRLTGFQKLVAAVAIVLTASNAVQMFMLNGPPPYAGKGSPPRTTFNIAESSKYWTAGLFTRVLDKPALLGMSAPMPHIPGDHENTGLVFPTDPAAGPLALAGKTLEVTRRSEIGFPVIGDRGNGNAAGLAYDPSSKLFGIVSTDAGMYYVEDDFTTVRSHAIIDRPNGSDIGHTVDATFTGPGNLVATAWNKTIYGAQTMAPEEVDEDAAWVAFLESSGDLMPSPEGRALLFTARAREAFTLSIAGDPTTGSYYTVSVPHAEQDEPQIVISQFATDNKLSREGVLATSTDLVIAEGGDLAGYYPVGADFHDGNIYLLSKAYNSLLVVDAETFEVTAVHGLPAIGDFSDIVVTTDGVFVLSRESGADVVYELSM